MKKVKKYIYIAKKKLVKTTPEATSFSTVLANAFVNEKAESKTKPDAENQSIQKGREKKIRKHGKVVP